MPLVPAQGVAGQEELRPQAEATRGWAMTVAIPLVVLAGAVVYVACHYLGLRIWHAIVAAIFGFLLAATSFAPQINSLLSGVAQWLRKP
jgi:uncharacterized membrane protein